MLRGSLLAIGVAAAALLVQASASAQQDHRMITKFEPVDLSLTDLLNQRWAIVSDGQFGFTLRKGDNWIVCGTNHTLAQPFSVCYALN